MQVADAPFPDILQRRNSKLFSFAELSVHRTVKLWNVFVLPDPVVATVTVTDEGAAGTVSGGAVTVNAAIGEAFPADVPLVPELKFDVAVALTSYVPAVTLVDGVFVSVKAAEAPGDRFGFEENDVVQPAPDGVADDIVNVRAAQVLESLFVTVTPNCAAVPAAVLFARSAEAKVTVGSAFVQGGSE